MARALPKRKRNPRTEVTFKAGGLTREILMMPPREQYNVLSAVRGPDVSEDRTQNKLKHIIVERLRSIVFSDSMEFPGCYDNTPMGKLEFDTAMAALLAYNGGPLHPLGASHYLDHLRLALKATWSHKVWGKYGLDLHRAVAKAVGF